MNDNVVILTQGEKHEVWGSLKRLCTAHKISYNYLKAKKYPFVYRGVTFERVKFSKLGEVKF